MAGCLLAALTYMPLFKGLTHYVNPELEAASARTPITMTAGGCNFHVFVGPWSKFSECDKAKDFLTKQGVSFTSVEAPGDAVTTKIGDMELQGWDEAKYKAAMKAAGFPTKADTEPDQLVHGRADPVHHGPLRDHGLRADRRVPGRALSGAHPVHVDVAALSHRQRLVRRHAAAAGHGDGGVVGQHLQRALVPDRRRGVHAHRRHARHCARPRTTRSASTFERRRTRAAPAIAARRR